MSIQSVGNDYHDLVELNYQLYNGLFLTLPLDAVQQTGVLLPLLGEACREGLDAGVDPEQILNGFFASHRPDFDEDGRAAFLFKVIQYVERQIVLVDALEDAAFDRIHQTAQRNELHRLAQAAVADNLADELLALLERFRARVTLTAHPTQFYPGKVLAIITDLTDAIRAQDIAGARGLLQQLGNTPFFNKEKPTPLDEAVNLGWYLGNIFYPAIGRIHRRLAEQFESGYKSNPQLLSVGFWPGGDRDGNPLVRPETTAQVAAKLRNLIIRRYHKDVRRLKRRLSFAGVYERLEAIERSLHREIVNELEAAFGSPAELIAELGEIREIVRSRYQSLYLDSLDAFLLKLRIFGFHFASLDIRQDSRVLAAGLAEAVELNPGRFPAGFDKLDPAAKADWLLRFDQALDWPGFESGAKDPLFADTMGSLALMREIQARNGELACHRYIISNCRGPLDVATLMALLRGSGWERPSVDIVPLFETIADLEQAGEFMASLYANPVYREHLRRRGCRQTVMLGFSDGTKDGGYVTANWSIFKSKEDITRASRAAGVEVNFFDGRGGPPARGGGSTYRFYAALGRNIESNQIQLTVQGQTISSHYGTREAARHNLRQLLAAGLENNLYERPEREIDPNQRKLLESLSAISFEHYQRFKSHPQFLPYLEQMSTMSYYSQSNIASRPSRRGSREAWKFEEVRAIPFVGAWGQLGQNVPGFFGLGAALKQLADAGKLGELKELYQRNRFFRTLIGNSMQSMSKANFDLTAYLAKHPRFGEFWRLIHAEFRLSREMVLEISGQRKLLEDHPASRLSIELRRRIVLPLLVIQQFAFIQVNRDGLDESARARYEKMIIRCMFGNINAARNSA